MPANTPPAARTAIGRGRTVGIVSVITLAVALVGYLREATLAARFGVSGAMDAYFAAITVPTILYFVLVTGTFTPVFIPILMQKGDLTDTDKASTTFSVVANFILVVMSGIALLGTLSAQIWLPLLFPGFDAETLRTTTKLVRMIFPAVVFLAMAGVLTATLNGYRKFALPAIAPAMSSILVIAGAWLARGENAIYIVGIATTAGFLCQFLFLVPATSALGLRYRLNFDVHHPAVRKLLQLGIPLFLYLVVANTTIFLERSLASRISVGAVSVLAYALRIFTVPANLLAAPLATVVYPDLAAEAARGGKGLLQEKFSRAARMMVFLFLPLTIWVVWNADFITRVLYEHGKFSAADATVTAQALMLYGIGILPNALAIILLRCLYALQDTMTPLYTELVGLACYALTAMLVVDHWGIAGLAAVRGACFYLVTILLTGVLVFRHGTKLLDRSMLLFTARLLPGTLAMASVIWLSHSLSVYWFDSAPLTGRIAVVIAGAAVGMAVYLLVTHVCGVAESGELHSTLFGILRTQRSNDRSI